MILYGIPTCDTCRRALKTLQAAGKAVTFRDIRSQPLTEAEIDAIVSEFGDRVINKQSTTYRGFSDFLRVSDTEAQIAAQPTAMKRPIIQNGAKWYLGWDEAVEAALVG